MADAFLIFALLASLVVVGAAMMWDLSATIDREVRRGRIEAERDARSDEDEAWAEFFETRTPAVSGFVPLYGRSGELVGWTWPS